MQQTLIVGVDIAKQDFAVAYRVGAVTVELGKFVNNAEGYAALQNRLAQGCTEHGLHQIQLAEEVTQLDSLLKRRLNLEQSLHQEQTRLSEMAGRPGLAPQVEESLRQVIEALTQALAGIEQAIEELTARHAPFQTNLARLMALPGVGPKVVLPLLVKLFQWHNLTSGEGDAAGLVAYIGLDPQPYESGRSVRKHAGISKMGDSEESFGPAVSSI